MTSVSPVLSTMDSGRIARRAALAAVGVAAFLILIKGAAWLYTGSVSLLGSLMDSGLDLLASAVNVVAIHEAAQPADRDHRFGHGKAEAIAGLGQCALITASAFYLVSEASSRLIHPVSIEHGFAAVVVIVLSMIATIGLVLYQRRIIARTGSLAISADSLHYRGDLLLNAGALLGVLGAGELGLPWLDPAVGLLVAGWIGYSAFRIFKIAYEELLDHEFDENDRTRIKEIVNGHADVRAMHDLRTRRSGGAGFIQLHIELDPAISLLTAHTISDAVEADIRRAFPNTDVIIHEDPSGAEKPHSFANPAPLVEEPGIK